MLIQSKEQFNQFVQNVVPGLAPEEVYFLSLSARNKYLTAEERERFGLGRTEMFGRVIGYGDFNYTFAKLEAVLTYKRTKNGHEIPEKALVVYMNINPSNSVKAAAAFSAVVNKVQTEMLNSYLNGSSPNSGQLLKADRLLMNEFQKATGTRHYLDIDVDAPFEFTLEITQKLHEAEVAHHLIKTRGGHHVLVYRESLNDSKYPLHKTVTELHTKAAQFGGEVLFNGNAMIPVPGTLQGGSLVELVY